MWIKLLPMNIRPEGHKDVVYKSYEEVSIALADHGISLELNPEAETARSES